MHRSAVTSRPYTRRDHLRFHARLVGCRDRLNTVGELPVNGAKVTITSGGETTLFRGWSSRHPVAVVTVAPRSTRGSSCAIPVGE